MREEYHTCIVNTVSRHLFSLILFIDCEKMKEDAQCKHEVMKASPIVGAGHHVRAKSNVPIIGILTQPIPS